MIVFHAHVPRTGGTAAGHSLSIGFTRERFVKYRSREQVRQDPKMAQETVAVSGHFGWGLHELFGRDHLYFIVLRDPVERVGSLYDYVLARKAHRYNELWTATPLHRVLAEKLSPIPLSNAVVRQLGGGFGHPKSPVTEAMMERAWKNISQGNVIVTFTDMLNDGLLQLAGQTGVQLRRVTKIHNAAKKKTSNSPETIELIRQTNALDIELYERARSAFANRLENPARLPEVSPLEVYRERIARVRAEQDAFETSARRIRDLSARLRATPTVRGKRAVGSFRRALERLFRRSSDLA